MIQRISGLFLLVLAVVIAIHTVAEPLYHTSTEAQPNSPFWTVLNPVMAAAIILGFAFSYIRKSDIDDDDADGTVTREFLAANLQFYGFLFVGILFLWNWFGLLNPAFTATEGGTVSLVWIIVDAALSLLAGSIGAYLWQSDSDS